jgi:hypothetical protein
MQIIYQIYTILLRLTYCLIIMNKSKLAGALFLLVSIISPSCDSKPKPASTKHSPPESAPEKQEPIGTELADHVPAEPTQAEEVSNEVAPSENESPEQSRTELPATNHPPAKEALVEEDSVFKAKLDYLKMLVTYMGNALEQKNLENVSALANEVQKVASEVSSDQEKGVSQLSEMTVDVPREPEAESDPAESSDGSSLSETSETQDEYITEEQASNGEPQSDENAAAEKEVEQKQPSKFQIRIDVILRTSSKREGYHVREKVSLKIKVANLSLKEETGPVSLHYFILGKGTKSNDEFVLFDSGEEFFELGKTQADRSFEYTPKTFTNIYGISGGSGNFKYDVWFVAVIDDKGKIIATKSNKQNMKDYNLIKNMEKKFRYDKSLKKLEGVIK